MKKGIPLTVSIPAFNEEQTIQKVAKQALKIVKGITYDFELLLINDGSTDKTGEIIDNFAKKNSKVRVIHNKKNSGFSGVITQSLLSAGKDYVFLGPADGQFDYHQMKKFVEVVGDSEVVTAYRTVNAEPLQRKIQSAFYHLLAKLLFGIRLKEFTSVSLWKKKALEKIEVKSHPKSNMALIELVYKIQKNGGKFAEVPIEWHRRGGGEAKGKINFALILSTLKEILRLFLLERANNTFKTKALLLVVTLSVAWEIFCFSRFPQQAWVQGLTEAWYVSKGLHFYKDFLGTYTPFLRGTMIPLHNIFGFTQETTILLYLITSLSTFFLLLFASVKFLRGWARILPILFFTLWNQYLTGNHFTTPTFLGLVILIVFILWKLWIDKKNPLLAFFIGLVSAIGFFSMQILTPFVGVVFASILLVSFNKRIGLNHFFIAILGFLSIGIPILVWIISDNIFKDFYYWTIKYHLTDYPYSSFGKSLNDILVFLAVHSPIPLLISLLFWQIRRRSKKNMFFLFSLILLLISLTLPTWFAIFHPIRFQMSLPLLALALGFGVSKFYLLDDKQKIIQISILALIFILNIIVWIQVVPSYIKRSLTYPSAKHIISKFYPDDPMYNAIVWIKDNTPINSKLFVIGDALFYFESKRLPSSTRATTNIPIAYQPREDLVNELREQPPDYWVIDERQWRRFEDFGFKDTAIFLKNLLLCDQLLVKIEYISIYKRDPKEKFCLK